jgi:transposase
MEDVLGVYGQAAEEQVVRLCVDERPCQLLDEVVQPLLMKEGKSKRLDNEYERKGTCCLFLAYDLERGLRFTQVREHRGKADYAAFMDWVIRQYDGDTQKILLVQDNLNTHTKGAFYEHLPLKRASELSKLLELHFTPKHGSWLNMVEIEFSALVRQCLNHRIGSITQLKKEVKAWVKQRNQKKLKIHWSFTVKEAREKLYSWYKKVNPKN